MRPPAACLGLQPGQPRFDIDLVRQRVGKALERPTGSGIRAPLRSGQEVANWQTKSPGQGRPGRSARRSILAADVILINRVPFKHTVALQSFPYNRYAGNVET